MKASTVTIGLVAIGFAAAGGWASWQRLAPVEAMPASVSALFSQTLPDLNGTSQAVAQWQGKPLLVNFWATWCAPCVQEMPELSALQTELSPAKIQILGIGIDSPSNIREFAAKLPVSYPLYVGGMGGSELARQFGNQSGGLPFTVLIGADGRIRHTYLGRLKINDIRRDLAAM